MYVSSTSGVIRVNGQRCRLQKCQFPKHPPIVLLGGMAQTIASWEHHVSSLSRDRDLLIYECLGQGPNEDETSYHNVSLPFQARLLCDTIEKAFDKKQQVDVVGFSLGGRIAMAAAAAAAATWEDGPTIRRLHVTGVASNRSPAGVVAVESWKDWLRRDNLRGFARSAIRATYSPTFLQSNANRMPSWVRHVVDSNTVEGLRALVEQTYVDKDDPWHTSNMAGRIKINGRLTVGELDTMAPVQGAMQLNRELRWGSSVKVFENGGHAVPMEQPREWRRDVLDFLNKDIE